MTKKKTQKWKFPKIVFLVFLVVFLLLYIQFAYLSLSPVLYGKDMDEFASQRSVFQQTLMAKRGSIFDKDGNSLALNVSSYTVIAYLDENRSKNSSVFLHVVDKEKTAKALSPVLNMEEADLLKLLNRDVKQVELGPGGRGITELKKEEITELNLPGIGFVESQKRYYPNGDFASYILGYAKSSTEEGNTIIGELGIESKYNDLLKGEDGHISYQKDRFGYKIPDTKETRIDEINGSNIYLTIDSNIQRFAESAIKEQSSIYNPEWMFTTIMNAKTGEILASATSPSFDPNIRNIKNYENPLSSYLYEPGSTMKTYTYMCAIEKGNYNGNATYKSGNIVVDNEGNIVNDWDPKGWGQLTYDQGYTYSSNVAIANIVKTFINRNELKECFEKFGFGSQTGIELSRELSGSIEFVYPLEVAAAGYGQGILTTPIQHLQALSMIANDGIMLKPHIISKIVDPNDEKIIHESKVDKTGQIISSSTAIKMKDLMYDTVNAEWAKTSAILFKIPGVKVIGKSGTAQIYDNKTNKYLTGTNDYIYSFSGMFPAEDPEIIIYTAMKQPKYDGITALSNAAKSTMANISKYLQLTTDEIANVKEITVNSYIGKSVSELDTLKDDLNVIVIGNGDKIIKQYPMNGTKLLAKDKLFIITNDKEIKMPNLIGYSKLEAVSLLNILNINYELEGYGYVVSQSIEAGKEITDKVKISLLNKSYMEDIKKKENETE